ncbi:SGNH/GDSL hydrolase family protein [Trujillonella endophytica]|uniref:Lysophospholipase L1 n=1 Tax=Trujillonella endophytica TaxID=673521 RepID=A0A1H8WMA4_9ACTN|nr:SGNH/GDSL hydrolase family protein [Trujillella endophytica]SEP28810.1 Lysophospholipase L1 [Trujillella endophytica]
MTGRRIRCLLAAVLGAAGLAACGADGDAPAGVPGAAGVGTPSASSTPTEGTYLALGDSVPFGYVAQYPTGYDDVDVFVGYPALIGQDRALAVVNLACPGETTGSLIDEAAPSNGCTNDRGQGEGFRDQYPLHVGYEGSQLDHAVRVLQDTDDVELVTLQIGVNDAFICQDVGACADPAGFAALAEQVRANVDRTLWALRGTGYAGRIVVLSYYASDYTDALATWSTDVLNSGIVTAARAHGVDVASAYAGFRPVAEADGGSSVDAGLLFRDEVHPTPAGHRLLADLVEELLDA